MKISMGCSPLLPLKQSWGRRSPHRPPWIRHCLLSACLNIAIRLLLLEYLLSDFAIAFLMTSMYSAPLMVSDPIKGHTCSDRLVPIDCNLLKHSSQNISLIRRVDM